MNTKIIVPLMLLTLVLASCGTKNTYEVIETNDTQTRSGIWNEYNATLCKTKTDVRIDCAGCSTEYYSICTVDKNLQGIPTCFC